MLKNDTEIVVVGLGYVGLTLAAFMADRGFRVHGAEIRETVLDNLSRKKAFFTEAHLDETLGRVIENGTFTFSEKIPISKRNRIFIITVGTPLKTDRTANLDFITTVSAEVAQRMNVDDFVILRSTVKLGTTNRIVRPILESSGKTFGLAFCPERTLEGAALSELGNLPQIIGAETEIEKKRAADIFNEVTSSVVMVSNTETAELIKLTDNMQRDVNFAISNEVAKAANKFRIKASEVISAGKIGYPRTNLFSPGPVGGPCLEKDSYLLAESIGWSESLALAARTVNESIVAESTDYIVNHLKSHSLLRPKICLLGLAFKGIPETNDLRGSVSIKLFKELKSKLPNSQLSAFDITIENSDLANLDLALEDSIENAFQNKDAVLIINNHPIFNRMNVGSLSMRMNQNALIYDYWGRFDQITNFSTNVAYSSWGSHCFSKELK
jgi:UDP-N-acetyl-D-mannosaminuronic acid dehydrogenase